MGVPRCLFVRDALIEERNEFLPGTVHAFSQTWDVTGAARTAIRLQLAFNADVVRSITETGLGGTCDRHGGLAP